MPIQTVNPTSNASPDPGQGGAGVTTPTNIGHAATTSSQGDTGSTLKTCLWSAFQSVFGQILSITLKYDWSYEGDFFLSSETGDGNASISVQIQYSINGGGGWTTSRSAGDSGVVVGNDTDSGGFGPASGSDSIVIPANTPLSNIRVRDRISATMTVNGDASGGADASLTVGAIRLEVETLNQTYLVVMM